MSIAIVGSPDSARALGIRLGIEEAQRTAELIGFHLDVHTASSEATTPADVVIVASDDATPPANTPASSLLDISTHDDACSPDGRLLVLPSGAERAALASAAGSDIVAWHPSLYRYGAEQLNRRFVQRFGEPMDEAAWSGWFAVKAAVELALARRDSGGVSARPPGFDGHKGARLTFDDSGRLGQPLYRVAGEAVEEIAMSEVLQARPACE